jgi:hypothetical protein
MISANIVTQILTVTTSTPINDKQLGEGGGGGRCGCGKPNDFMAILDSISAQQPDGIAANSPFFSGSDNFSFPQSQASDMVDLLAGILNGAGDTGDEQTPFDFLQSLSASQMTTFQGVQYSTQSSTGDSRTVKSIQVIMQRITDVEDTNAIFPPANAPAGIQDAWDSATKGANQKDITMVSGMLFSMALNQSSSDTAEPNQVDAAQAVETDQDIISWELDQYWQQVEALLALIDKSLMKDPDKEADIEGAKGLLTNFLDELEKTEETATVS